MKGTRADMIDRMHSRLRLPAFLLTVALVAAIAAGCGGGSDGDGGDTTTTGSGAALVHADGTIAVGDDGMLTLKPANGDDTMTFELGDEVQRGTIRALEASGAKTRVSFRVTDQTPVAVSVVPAPEIGADAKSYVGTVVTITSEQIVVDGPDGERAFTIAPADRIAFDVPHLSDHADKGEAVRVFYRSTPAGDAGIAYEDA